MIKPALPYVSDLVNHVFFYTKHMATVHYENGKYHVHKEVVDHAKKEASQKAIPTAKKESSTTEHTSIQQNELAVVLLLNRTIEVPVSTALQHNYPSGDYPPPRS